MRWKRITKDTPITKGSMIRRGRFGQKLTVLEVVGNKGGFAGFEKYKNPTAPNGVSWEPMRVSSWISYKTTGHEHSRGWEPTDEEIRREGKEREKNYMGDGWWYDSKSNLTTEEGKEG